MKSKIDELSLHELLDRTSTVIEMLNILLRQHKDFNKLDKKTKSLIKKAGLKLSNAYQLIGEVNDKTFL